MKSSRSNTTLAVSTLSHIRASISPVESMSVKLMYFLPVLPSRTSLDCTRNRPPLALPAFRSATVGDFIFLALQLLADFRLGGHAAYRLEDFCSILVDVPGIGIDQSRRLLCFRSATS